MLVLLVRRCESKRVFGACEQSKRGSKEVRGAHLAAQVQVRSGVKFGRVLGGPNIM